MAALAPTRARADNVPPNQQALVLMRALAYDDNLKSRAGGSVLLAVLYRPGSASSEQMADATYRAFKDLESVKVQELPFKVVKLAWSDKDTLRSQIASQGIDELYLCAGVDGDLNAITGVSRNAHVLTMAAREELVQRGATIGIFIRNGKGTMVVNAAASHAEGVSFSSQLLRLAEIVH